MRPLAVLILLASYLGFAKALTWAFGLLNAQSDELYALGQLVIVLWVVALIAYQGYVWPRLRTALTKEKSNPCAD